MTQDTCIFDDMPCTCDAGRPCMMTEHDIDIPDPPSWATVYTPSFMAVLLIAGIGLLGMAGAIGVHATYQLERQLAMEARR